jgi:hypothetical protein
MQHYAIYLDSRIRAYRDMKHDAVQVQSEAQRDARGAKGLDREKDREKDSGLKRGKTLAGRKLRIMSVEKGLLRETKAVQKQIDTLVECKVGLSARARGVRELSPASSIWTTSRTHSPSRPCACSCRTSSSSSPPQTRASSTSSVRSPAPRAYTH